MPDSPTCGVWDTALASTADPDAARSRFRTLHSSAAPGRLDGWSPESRRTLVAVLAASRVLSETLARHPEWLDSVQDTESLRHPRTRAGLERDLALPGNVSPLTDTGALARFRLRELLRIAARDLGGFAPLPEVTLELSAAADLFLDAILRRVVRDLTARFGQPWHQDALGRWHPTAFTVLGLGKLGGEELNYSSDVDLLFVYTDEGSVFRTTPDTTRRRPAAVLPNHRFFRLLSEAFLQEAARLSPAHGGLRIDLRLRPEGDAGPIARSVESCETYYSRAGQGWERLMLLKARHVAGDVPLAAAFLETIQPFRYPGAIADDLLTEMADLKARTEQEGILQADRGRHVKLGPGGIRDIEFVTQVLQVLHGSANPFVQSPQTLDALSRLARYRLLDPAAATRLTRAYTLLRTVEHRLQLTDFLQTHTLPSEPRELDRIARLLGRDSGPVLLRALETDARGVRTIFNRILRAPAGRTRRRTDARTPPHPEARTSNIPALPPDPEDPAPWIERLQHHGYQRPKEALPLVRSFLLGSGVGHLSHRTTRMARQLLPRILALSHHHPDPRPRPGPTRQPRPATHSLLLADPDQSFTQLVLFIEAYGARASLYDLWLARPALLDHLLRLFDASEFLARLATHTPDLLESLESGHHLHRSQSAAQTLDDLRAGIHRPDPHQWIRTYAHAEFLRIGLRDILGFASPESIRTEWTHLADACLQYAVEVVTRRHRLVRPPFAVLGLGKLGGAELDYGSDLDVLLVAPDSTPAHRLPRLAGFASELIDLLSNPASPGPGPVFRVDTRLRPDGVSGPIVSRLQANASYYRHRAAFWEIQTLTRCRAVAGDPETGKAFVALARQLTDLRSQSPVPAAPPGPAPDAGPPRDWRSAIAHMRERIHRERTPPGLDSHAFKTGTGGLIDLEFTAQTLCLAHGIFEPNTLQALGQAAANGHVGPREARHLIDACREIRRIESILRRRTFTAESLLPTHPAELHRLALRCGYPDATTLLTTLGHHRNRVRRIADRLLPPISDSPPRPTSINLPP